MPGVVEAIWLKTAHRGAMASADRVRARAHHGLLGNSNQGGRRQVTVLSAEAWGEATSELGRSLDPRIRRANLLVRGLDLEASSGRILVVGRVPILIHGETRPCRRMDAACSGLRQRLATRWRGGAYGEVLADGEIAVGDRVRWQEAVAAAKGTDLGKNL